MGSRMGLQEDSEGRPRDSGQERGRKGGKGGFSAGLTGDNAAGIGKAMGERADDRGGLSGPDGLAGEGTGPDGLGMGRAAGRGWE